MCFVQMVQSSKLVAPLRGRQDSMNLLARGKRKFVFQPHIDKKTRRLSLFPIRKSQQSANPKTSKFRQAVKPGRNRIDPVGEAASFPQQPNIPSVKARN